MLCINSNHIFSVNWRPICQPAKLCSPLATRVQCAWANACSLCAPWANCPNMFFISLQGWVALSICAALYCIILSALYFVWARCILHAEDEAFLQLVAALLREESSPRLQFTYWWLNSSLQSRQPCLCSSVSIAWEACSFFAVTSFGSYKPG